MALVGADAVTARQRGLFGEDRKQAVEPQKDRVHLARTWLAEGLPCDSDNVEFRNRGQCRGSTMLAEASERGLRRGHQSARCCQGRQKTQSICPTWGASERGVNLNVCEVLKHELDG